MEHGLCGNFLSVYKDAPEKGMYLWSWINIKKIEEIILCEDKNLSKIIANGQIYYIKASPEYLVSKIKQEK